jgi:hypothetical protein
VLCCAVLCCAVACVRVYQCSCLLATKRVTCQLRQAPIREIHTVVKAEAGEVWRGAQAGQHSVHILH